MRYHSEAWRGTTINANKWHLVTKTQPNTALSSKFEGTLDVPSVKFAWGKIVGERFELSSGKSPNVRFYTEQQIRDEGNWDLMNVLGIHDDLREEALRIFADASKGKTGQVVRLPVPHQPERTEQMAAGPIEQKLQHQ